MKHIVVLCGEVWSPMTSEDAEIWTITDEGYKKLCGEHENKNLNVDVPKHLDDADIVSWSNVEDFVLKQGLGGLDSFMQEESESAEWKSKNTNQSGNIHLNGTNENTHQDDLEM